VSSYIPGARRGHRRHGGVARGGGGAEAGAAARVADAGDWAQRV
jgi:hypothetical protein